MTTTDPLPAADLRGRTFHATKWASILSVSLQSGRLLLQFVLAGILGPDTFGLAARVLAVGVMLDMASEFGFIASVIQRKDLTQRHIDTAYWTNLGLSVFVAFAAFAGVVTYARLEGESEFLDVLRYIVLLPVVLANGNVQRALLMRDLEFRGIAFASMAGTVAYISVGTGLALAGAGVWSILAGFYASHVVTIVFFWRASSWRPKFQYGRRELRDLLSFGSFHALSKILSSFARGIDVLLIGNRIDNAAAGFYSVGMRVASTAGGEVGNVLNNVMFSSFSRIQDDRARMGAVYVRGTRLLALVSTAPLVLAYAAVPIIPAILGDDWSETVAVARVLCFFSMWDAVGGTLVPPLLSGLGRSDWSFGLAAIRTSLLLVVLLLALPYGLFWTTVAIAIHQAVCNLLAQWWVMRAIGVTLESFLWGARGAFTGFGMMAASTHLLEPVLPTGGLWTFGSAAMLMAINAAAYVIGVSLVDRRAIPDVRDALIGILRSRRGVGRATPDA